jgi:uncharacterized OB-fold protein
MQEYRKTIKEHFESKPFWRSLLAIDWLFWGGGIVLSSLGGALASVTYHAAAPLNAVGDWTLLFGLVLAFMKKSDLGLIIGTAGIALETVVMIILSALRGVVGYSSIFGVLVYGTRFVAELVTSDTMKQAKLNRARQAALPTQIQPPMQPQTTIGVICASCGAMILGDSMFCNACGAKRPEQRKCSACGSEVANGAQFCNKCGASMDAQTVCPSCGKTVTAADMFCPGCGAKTRGA